MCYGAFWIAHVTITDPVKYKGYQALAPIAFARHGAVFLARGTGSTLEGPALERHVLIGFPDLASAQACYDSAEYIAARNARDRACTAHIVLVEALAPPPVIG